MTRHTILLRVRYAPDVSNGPYHLVSLLFNSDDFDGRHVHALRELGYHFGMHYDAAGKVYFTIERDDGTIVLEPVSHVEANGWDDQLTCIIKRGYDELIPHEVPGAVPHPAHPMDGYVGLGSYPFDNEGRD